MIKNRRQYAISERRLKFCITLRKKLLGRLHRAPSKEAAMEEIDDLQRKAILITRQLKEYDGLRTGRIAPPDLNQTSCLPENLIRARIAIGWTPQEFARKCAVHPAQVNRWEKTNYAMVSLKRVLEVACVLEQALIQRGPQDERLLGAPLKLGADWFDSDFRQLPEES